MSQQPRHQDEQEDLNHAACNKSISVSPVHKIIYNTCRYLPADLSHIHCPAIQVLLWRGVVMHQHMGRCLQKLCCYNPGVLVTRVPIPRIDIMYGFAVKARFKSGCPKILA